MTIWLNGEWVEDGAAVCAADDRGLLLGDGLFETLRFCGGELVRLAAHERRLRAGCEALGLACPLDGIELESIAAQLAARAGLPNAAIRLSLTAGAGERGLDRSGPAVPACLITAAPLAAAPARLSLATSSLRRSGSSIAARHKTLSYIDNVMARREARLAGAGMALLLDTEGRLSGADCANLFWIRDGALFTPSLGCAALPGTARGALLDALDVEQGAFAASALSDANCVFVTNALFGAVPVGQVDGAPVGGEAVPDEILALLNRI